MAPSKGTHDVLRAPLDDDIPSSPQSPRSPRGSKVAPTSPRASKVEGSGRGLVRGLTSRFHLTRLSTLGSKAMDLKVAMAEEETGDKKASTLRSGGKGADGGSLSSTLTGKKTGPAGVAGGGKGAEQEGPRTADCVSPLERSLDSQSVEGGPVLAPSLADSPVPAKASGRRGSRDEASRGRGSGSGQVARLAPLPSPSVSPGATRQPSPSPALVSVANPLLQATPGLLSHTSRRQSSDEIPTEVLGSPTNRRA